MFFTEAFFYGLLDRGTQSPRLFSHSSPTIVLAKIPGTSIKITELTPPPHRAVSWVGHN